MDFYQYQRGYPHAHRDFYFGKDCEGWIDQHLSNPLLHSQRKQAVRERYFKSWKSYPAIKKSCRMQKPKPPNKHANYMTTRFKRYAIRFVERTLLLQHAHQHGNEQEILTIEFISTSLFSAGRRCPGSIERV